ncbi:MAG: hypothetical protein LBV43_07770 [Prevotella sp.]|jgi:hypothetical protein|nr:hypothetical protein [Prevotella sp.]
MKNPVKYLIPIILIITLFAACSDNNGKSTNDKRIAENVKSNDQGEKSYKKKYTNADFYTDGKFNQDIAMKAYKDMFEFYNYPFTPLLEKDMWVTDFGLGDFENVGMGGVFWINDDKHGYFAHAIYLLPDQMIPEHAHVKTEYPAKHEAWMVTKGWAYNFSEIGEQTSDAPKIPEKHGVTKSKNYVIQKVGEVISLKELESFHFLMAGSEGAIVDEWASYHDGAGLRFTNPGCSL